MRTTITINDTLFRALKMRAVESDTKMSQLVEDALKYQLLDDLEDLEVASTRANEPNYSFSELVGQLKAEGLL